jgi:hypothetical protein
MKRLMRKIPGKIAAIIQQDLSLPGIRLTTLQEEWRIVMSRLMTSGDSGSVLVFLDFPIAGFCTRAPGI